MPVISAGDLTALRSEYQRTDVRISWLVPPVLWQARINDGSIVKGTTSITFDSGTGSFFTLVAGLQEVWVGSAAGANDVGRLRIKSISSGDSGVTGTLTVAGHSHPLQDDQYLTFFHDYPIKPKYSYIDLSENYFMDDNVTYTDQHTKPPPVVIAGPHRAGFLVSGTATFNVDASDSYTIANGATVSTYALSVASTAGTPTVNFNTGTGLGDITFTLPGYYWAKYTVTDSNAKSQISYRLYILHDPDADDASYPFVDCTGVQLEADWENGGWTAGVSAEDNMALADIPDHTLCIIWHTPVYNGSVNYVTYLPDDNPAVFVGYVREDSGVQQMAEGYGEAELVLSTVEGRLRRMFAFSTSLIVSKNAPGDWYEYEEWQTCGTIAHDLFLWRSTLLEVADVIGLRDDTLNRMFQAFDEGNIYDNANNFLYSEGIRKRVLCDQGGRVHVVSDPQLLNDTDRGALVTAMEFVQTDAIADYGAALAIQRRPEFEAPFVTANGIYWDGGTWDDEDRPLANGEYCAIAPGGKPLWEGPDPQDFPKQTVASQDDLNKICGRYEAKVNNPFSEIAIEFHGMYNTVLDIAYGEEYLIDFQATETPREIVWSNKPLYCKHVQATYDASIGVWEVSASFEPENITTDGIYTECPSFPELGGAIPPVIEPTDLPGALITGASINFKPATGELWDQRLTQDVTDLVEDPFWRTKAATQAPNSAIMFRCGVGYIKRTTDAFDTVDVDVTPSGDPPNNAGDSPAPTVANVTFTMGEGSRADQDTFVFLARWQNGSGVWRSWFAVTENNGTSWVWKAIGAAGTETISSFGSTTSVYNGSGDVQNLSGYGNAGMNKTLCVLSSTKAVQVWADNGPTYQIQGTVINISGDTLTPATTDYVLNSGDETSGNTPYVMSAVALSDSKFVVVWVYYNGSIWPGIKAANCTVAGDVITPGSAASQAITNDGDTVRVAAWSANECLVVVGSGSVTGEAVILTTSGATPSFGSLLSLGNFGRSVDVAILSTSRAVVISEDDGSGNSYGNVLGIGRSGITLYKSASPTAFGNAASQRVHSIGVRQLDDYRFLISWYEDVSTYEYGYCRVGMWGGTTTAPTVTLYTPAAWDSFSYDVWAYNMAVVNPEFFIVGYEPQTATYPDVRHVLGKINPSTYGITYGTVATNTGEPADYAITIETLSPTKALLVRRNASEDLDAWTINFDVGAYDALGLGLSIGKSVGDKVWATANVGDELFLLEHALPGLAQSNTFSLGTATFAATEAKTWLAYPYVPYGYDDAVYVFGRMNNPQSLGSPSHVIRTTDGGSSFGLIENGWGTDHCGALILSSYGYLFAILNSAGGSKLYVDSADNILVLKLTLPFSSQVAPHGMFLNFFSLDVYTVAWTADSYMVAKIASPYITASNLTYDHDATEGGVAIIQL